MNNSSGFRPRTVAENTEVDDVKGELLEMMKTSEPGTFQTRVALRVIEERDNAISYLEQKFAGDRKVLRELDNVRRGAHRR